MQRPSRQNGKKESRNEVVCKGKIRIVKSEIRMKSPNEAYIRISIFFFRISYLFNMSSKNFEGHSAIVTGAGQGIGYEIAFRLAEQGAAVLLNDMDESLASEAVAKINERFGKCIVAAGDAA